eukprot:scaffold682775_cov57-Prasinocladus_malaysianus.AAC.1
MPQAQWSTGYELSAKDLHLELVECLCSCGHGLPPVEGPLLALQMWPDCEGALLSAPEAEDQMEGGLLLD